MNAYFFKMSRDEKNNILDQHKHVYDGYVTKYNQESNQTPIYVQDLANDKLGVTLDNKGNVKNYTNFRVNESPLDRIADGPRDLKNGTVDIDSIDDTVESNVEFMHDTYPSPNENEFNFESFGQFADEMAVNNDQYEYDIDELEDYSSEDISETFDDEESDTETFDDVSLDLYEIDEDDFSDVFTDIHESLDMFKRFKKYN